MNINLEERLKKRLNSKTILLIVLFTITVFSSFFLNIVGLPNRLPLLFILIYGTIGILLMGFQFFLPANPFTHKLYNVDVIGIHVFFVALAAFNHYTSTYIAIMLIFTAMLIPFLSTPKTYWISGGLFIMAQIVLLPLNGVPWYTYLFVFISTLFLYFSSYVVAVRDAKIKRYATFDSLTNLPNRQAAIQYLSSVDKEELYGILLFDIDNFKIFNDVFGHKTGDKVLIRVVQEIQKLKRPGDFMSRLSGDEFMLVIHNMKTSQEIIHYAEYITNLFVLKYNDTYSITISSGLIIYPDHSDKPTNLISYAALAMHKAKEYGKNNLYVYNKDLQLDHLQMYDTKKELADALTHHDLAVHYQPIFKADSEEIIAIEALVRWKKDNDFLEAKEFIPHCSDTQTIRLIDYFVLDTICAELERWLMVSRDIPPFSINISEKTFNDGIFIQEIKNRLYQYKIPSRYIIIEITESTLLLNHKYSQEALNELGSLGIRIMIDDFGTGYFSLNFLKSLHCDFLKIDPVFLENLDDNRTNREIINSIIALGVTFKRMIIAEGVETTTQRYYLRKLDCYGYQGYLFQKPIPIELLKDKYFPVSPRSH